MRHFLGMPLLMLALVSFTGCGTTDGSNDTQTAEEGSKDSGSGHSHDHADLGPHGGHMLHLEPSGSHAEWTHDDETHTVNVYLDDFQADNIKEAKFTATIGDEVEEFALESSDEGWTISSETLLTHIDMGEAVEVCLVIVDDTGEQTCTIEPHEHHHH